MLACEPDPLPGSALPDPAASASAAGSAAASAHRALAPIDASSDPRKVATLYVPPQGQPPAASATVEPPRHSPTGKGISDAILAVAKGGVLPPGEADKHLKAGEPPKVVLVDSGAEPRSPLSYDFNAGAKESTVMKMDMTMKMDAGPTAPPIAMQLPQIEMGLDLATAKDRSKSGDTPITGLVSLVKLNPGPNPPQKEVMDAMDAALRGLQGMSISYVVSPKGRSRDIKIAVPTGAPAEAKQMVDQMKSSFESMVAPLPDEPVGIGARWQVISRLSTGADILQWTTYTLEKRSGNGVELTALVNQLAADPNMTGPQLPPGAKATIGTFRSGGTGHSTLDLTRIAPETGGGDVKSAMSFNAGGQAMKVETTVVLRFARK